MIYLDLILNLSLLVALSIVSDFIESRWPQQTRLGVFLQGGLFGGTAVLGMLRPLNLGAGLIFDGRSVMVSLCALFYGPWAAAVAGVMMIACRMGLGGVGIFTGLLVILSSLGIGLLARVRLKPDAKPPSTGYLYLFGLVVHLVMLALMFTLPGGVGLSVVMRIGLPVILLYPLATILVGKILSDQVEARQVMKLLHESEDKFKSIFERSNVGKSITRPSGEMQINRAFCDMLGYAQAELQQQPWQAITHSEDVEPTQRVVDALLSGKQDSARFAKRYLHKNGSVVWTDVSTTLRRDEAGRPLYLLTTVIDISERKQAEAALRESEERFRQASSSMMGIAYSCVHRPDRGYQIDWMAGATEATLGYSIEEMYALGCWGRLVVDDDRPLFEKNVTGLPPGDSSKCELRLRKRDGALIWMDSYARCVASPDGAEGLRLFGALLNITERKQAEAALRESETLFRSHFEHHAAVKLIIDPDTGNIVDANYAAERFYGWSRDQLKQMRIQDINTLTPEEVNAEMERARAQERIRFEFRHRRADGSIRDVEVFASKITVHGKELLHSIVHDVSEQKRLERRERGPRSPAPPAAEAGGPRDSGGGRGPRDQQPDQRDHELRPVDCGHGGAHEPVGGVCEGDPRRDRAGSDHRAESPPVCPARETRPQPRPDPGHRRADPEPRPGGPPA